MSLRKKIVLCVAITAAMGIALMYCAAHYSAGVLDVESVVNVTDNILDYNNITMFSINSRGRFCQSNNQVTCILDNWLLTWILGNQFHCVSDTNTCKSSDIVRMLTKISNSKFNISMKDDMGKILADFNSGKAVICNALSAADRGYTCTSSSDSVIPEYTLALLKDSSDDLLKLVQLSLKDDIIKYSRYRMSSYVGKRCEEMPYTGTFVRSTCKLPLSLTSQAKLGVDNGKAGKCTEVVDEDFSSSVLSCKSRGEHLLDHVFSESGHYICSLKHSLKQGHSEL